MFAPLPDFTPRDSHSLWYTSSRNPAQAARSFDPVSTDSSSNHHAAHRQRSHVIERSTLARLAADEQYLQRRRMNIQNFGSGWLKPPGVPKTLYQLREEKREQDEHQEALRREQLAQELADAEASGMPEEDMDVQLDGAQDQEQNLDDDIPEAEHEFSMDDDDDEDAEDDDDEEEEDEDEDEDEDLQTQQTMPGISEADEDAMRRERHNELVAARMLMSGDAFREALMRGDPDAEDAYGEVTELDDEQGGHVLDEDDFATSGLDDGMGIDMDANLDDDIPEAESGGYEHTDSEAELTSSGGSHDSETEDEHDASHQDMGFVPRTAALRAPDSPLMRGQSHTSGDRPSLDISNILSQDESSFMNSSPAPGRRR